MNTSHLFQHLHVFRYHFSILAHTIKPGYHDFVSHLPYSFYGCNNEFLFIAKCSMYNFSRNVEKSHHQAFWALLGWVIFTRGLRLVAIMSGWMLGSWMITGDIIAGSYCAAYPRLAFLAWMAA
jgi:hypothetical protein